MTKLTNIFSTREIAFFIWIVVIITIILFKKEIRKSIVAVISAFFSRHLFKAFIIMLIYVFLTVNLLRFIDLWNRYLIKDTIFWFFTVALVTFFNLNKIQDKGNFKKVLMDSLKWTILIEFLINFYTFNIWIELILFPILLFITIIHTIVETDKKFEIIEKLFTKILTLIGIIIFIYVVYKTIVHYRQTFTIQNLKSLIHPITMTAFFLPFVYLLALYWIYKILFMRVDILVVDKKLRMRLKLNILQDANFNKDKLLRISKNLNIEDFTPNDIKGFVKRIS